MEELDQSILDGIRRVEAYNSAQRVQDSNGKYPVCIPRLGQGHGVSVCMRCGNPIFDIHSKACPAVPPEYRWSILFTEE